MVCHNCNAETERRGPSQKYCPVCAPKVKRTQNRKYRRYDDTEPIRYQAVTTGGKWRGPGIDICPTCTYWRDRFSEADGRQDYAAARAAMRGRARHMERDHGIPRRVEVEQLVLEGI